MSTIRGLCLVLLPVAIAVIGPVMLVTCYTIAVLRGDVSRLFPYISDTGGDAPESCIFGQLLNIIALLIFAGVILRYKQVESIVRSRGVHRLNSLMVWTGSLTALGASLVANFQDTTVIAVHYIGAMFLFLFGIIYGLVQSYISYKISYHTSRRWVCHLRLFLSMLASVTLVSCLVGSSCASRGWKDHHVHKTIFKWGPEDGGYPAHLVSTFSEWVMAVSLMSYFITFLPDFLDLTLILDLRFFQAI